MKQLKAPLEQKFFGNMEKKLEEVETMGQCTYR